MNRLMLTRAATEWLGPLRSAFWF